MLSEAKHPVNNGLFVSLRVTVAFMPPPSKSSNLVGSPIMAHQPRQFQLSLATHRYPLVSLASFIAWLIKIIITLIIFISQGHLFTSFAAFAYALR